MNRGLFTDMAAKEKVEEIMSKAQAWGKEAFKRTQEDLEKVEFLQVRSKTCPDLLAPYLIHGSDSGLMMALCIIPLVQKMEDTTRVPKLFLAGGAVVFILLLFLFNEGARFVV